MVFLGLLKTNSMGQNVVRYEKFEELQEVYTNGSPDTTYVVNFWATWCRPCVKELPYFESIHAAYKDSAVKVILVSLDFPNTIDSGLVPFVKRKGLKAMVAVLKDGNANRWIDMVDTSWSGALPGTLFVHGKYRRFYEKSYETPEGLKTDLLKAIRNKEL